MEVLASDVGASSSELDLGSVARFCDDDLPNDFLALGSNSWFVLVRVCFFFRGAE